MPSIEKMIEESREVAAKVLNKWECDFLDSLYTQINAGKLPSKKQRYTIRKIYDKVCASPF